MSDQPNTSGADAIEQANTYGGILANKTLYFDDGSTMQVTPHPSLGVFETAEQADEYEQYMFDIQETYDREPDIYIPEQTVERDGKTIVLPAETKRGAVKTPYRKDGVRCTPHNVRLVQIALGDKKYKQLVSKKIDKRPAGYGDVLRLWLDQGNQMKERATEDPKSVAGDLGVEEVPEADFE